MPRSPKVPHLRDHDRYDILGEHGRGGLGRVSRAHDRELGRDIAIKELISRGHLGEVRFLREALITARLEHPGIVPVYEAGRWADGTPFYAMKLVSGRSLRDLIAERKTVDERIGLLHHVIAVADAIAYAHGRGIIHRDLKPSNVIVGDFGETVVIDWGLAKDITATEEPAVGGGPFREHRDDGLTSAGTVLGTPAYMAPEQARGEPVDQRADVFAIGAMLWELCSLQKLPPSFSGQRRRILRKSGVDPDLITIIEKAVDPNPALRYPNAGALAADLKAFKAGVRVAARRYSLWAMLAHWTRRHRTAATASTTAVCFVILGVALYVRAVTAERDRADAALNAAEEQKQRAIIANAVSLLERDPTQAWMAIRSASGMTRQTAVLSSRIKAAGVADAHMSFSTPVDRGVLTPSRTRLVVSTQDRTLSLVELDTMTMRRLTDGMTEPSIVIATDTYIYAVRKTRRLVLTRIAIMSRDQEDVAELDQLPEDLMAGAAGVFWQTPDGSVHQLMPGHGSRVVASDVTQFSLAGSKLAICDKHGVLSVAAPGGAATPLGHCRETWAWGERDGNFAVPVDDGHLAVYWEDGLRLVNFATGRGSPHLTWSSTGTLAAVDAQGRGAYLRPGAAGFEYLRIEQPVVSTATEGDLVAWAFTDSSIKVRNITTHQEWTLKAHDRGLYAVLFLPSKGRLLTCARDEIRLWTLPSGAPEIIAELPAPAFHIVTGSDDSLLMDGADGEVYRFGRDTTSPLLLHKHSLLSFGVAWCDTRPCSASWDGRVLCSSPGATTSDAIASFGTAIRWLGEGSGHCFAAVSNGGIYDLRSPTTPAYEHGFEPYRVVVSPDGTRIASTDWGGTVKVWDIARHRVIADLERLHTGLVINVGWLDNDYLVTAGFDGFVRLLGPDMTIVRSWYVGGPVRYMTVSQGTIYAALRNGAIWSGSRATGTEYRIDLGTTFMSFAVSPTGSYIAAGDDSGELFIIDSKHRIAARRFERGAIGCATFQDGQTLLFCDPGGRILRLMMGEQSFEGDSTHEEASSKI